MNKKKNVGNIVFWGIVIALFIALVIIASLYDLAISELGVQQKTLFWEGVSKYGEAPAYIFTPFCASVLAIWLLKKRNWWGIIGFLLVEALNVSFFYKLIEYFFEHYYFNFWVYGVIAIVLAVLFSFLFSRLKKEKLNRLVLISLEVVIIVLITAYLTSTIKYHWGRVRFRELTSPQEFTPWYKINGYTDHRSFISGHASSCGILFCLLLIPMHFEKLKEKNWIFILASFVPVILVAISRIILSAHYLSDVLFGAALPLVLVFLVHYLVLYVNKKIKKRNAVNN